MSGPNGLCAKQRIAGWFLLCTRYARRHLNCESDAASRIVNLAETFLLASLCGL